MGRMKELSIEHDATVTNEGDHWAVRCPCGFAALMFGPAAEDRAHDSLGAHWTEVLGIEDALRHAPLRVVEDRLPDLAERFEHELAEGF
jgi:predicted TPR repeat methyltransferase